VKGEKLHIEWIWVLPVCALLLVACDYGGVARLMWDMQPAARRRAWPGPTGVRVIAGILAIMAIVTRLIQPANG
jgi:hypothetical protein